MKCLRIIDWGKLQNLLKEMDELPTDHFGEHAQPGILCWSSGGRIHHANESFCNLVGYNLDELRVGVVGVQTKIEDYNSASNNESDKIKAHTVFHPDEMMRITKRQLDAIQHPERSSYQLNTRLCGKSKQEIPVSCSVLNVRDTSALPLLTIAIFV